MMLNKEAIISCLIDKKICTKEEMEGCSLGNVEMLEKNGSLILPLQFGEFLLGLGRVVAILFQGTNIFFLRIFGLKMDPVILSIENVKTFLFRVLISYFRCIKGMSFVISILLKEMTLRSISILRAVGRL